MLFLATSARYTYCMLAHDWLVIMLACYDVTANETVTCLYLPSTSRRVCLTVDWLIVLLGTVVTAVISLKQKLPLIA